MHCAMRQQQSVWSCQRRAPGRQGVGSLHSEEVAISIHGVCPDRGKARGGSQ